MSNDPSSSSSARLGGGVGFTIFDTGFFLVFFSWGGLGKFFLGLWSVGAQSSSSSGYSEYIWEISDCRSSSSAAYYGVFFLGRPRFYGSYFVSYLGVLEDFYAVSCVGLLILRSTWDFYFLGDLGGDLFLFFEDSYIGHRGSSSSSSSVLLFFGFFLFNGLFLDWRAAIWESKSKSSSSASSFFFVGFVSFGFHFLESSSSGLLSFFLH